VRTWTAQPPCSPRAIQNVTFKRNFLILRFAHETAICRNPHNSAVPRLRRLVAGLSPLRPGFVYVGFVVDKVALGQVFPPSTSVFPCQFHSTGAPLQGTTKKKKLIIFITGLHNKPQGCGASVTSAAGPFTKKNSHNSSNWYFCITIQLGYKHIFCQNVVSTDNCFLYFRKNITCLRVGLLRIGQVRSVSYKTVCRWVTTNCCFHWRFHVRSHSVWTDVPEDREATKPLSYIIVWAGH
jgi:hypothetical protein